ncbi:hypothetical protein DL96DRAFT_1584591 [Flagelloscypha sp. PMI_526]|nr:hypothetical protein DL96DRAFT_1584591 [Flagelloscypha sp. PMI_526]
MASPVSETELRTYIALGSCFLSALNYSEPLFPVPRVSKELVMLRHLTTLLSSKTRTRDRVVAVTGPTTMNGFSVLLVTQNCGLEDARSEQVNLTEVKPSLESRDQILDSWATRPINNLDNYVADLLKIFTKADLFDSRPILYAIRYSAGYILYRCSLIWIIWGRAGSFRIISDHCANLHPKRDFPWKITVTLESKESFQNLLPKGPHEVKDGKLHFFLENLVQKILGIETRKGHFDLRDGLGEKDFKNIYIAMSILKDVLDARVLDEILTDSDLNEALEEARRQQSAKMQPGSSAGQDSSDDEDPEEARLEEEEILEWQSTGQYRHPFIRYLNSLCTWYTAVAKLQTFVSKSSTPPIVYHVTMVSPDRKDTFDFHRKQFIESVVAHSSDEEERKAIRAQLEHTMTNTGFSDHVRGMTTAKNSNSPTYHAEAIAMALGAAIRENTSFLADSGPHLQFLRTIFQPQSKTFIGANKKCCWFCWRLYEAYNKTGSVYDMAATHGKVYPWAAPPFGLSASILEDIWKHVKEAIFEATLNHPVTRSSVGSESEGEQPRPKVDVVKKFFTDFGVNGQ